MQIARIPLVPEQLIDSSEVAQALSVSRRTVESDAFQRRLGIKAVILGRRLTRFHPGEVREAIARAASDHSGEPHAKPHADSAADAAILDRRNAAFASSVQV